MIVVSDASPLNVLVRIGHVEILEDLFGSVIIPPAVAAELTHARTPDPVRAWLAAPPGVAGDSLTKNNRRYIDDGRQRRDRSN